MHQPDPIPVEVEPIVIRTPLWPWFIVFDVLHIHPYLLGLHRLVPVHIPVAAVRIQDGIDDDN